MATTNSVAEGADTTAIVSALLQAAGLRIPDDEVERLAQLYPELRSSIDRFYAVDVGDEVPAAVFRAGDGESSGAADGLR